MKNNLLKYSITMGFLFSTGAVMSGEKVEVKVKGMVCSFCAQGIKKKFSSLEAVSKIDVNLDDKWVKMELLDNKTLSDEEIKKSITDAGYEVVSIERTASTATEKTK